MSDIKEINGLLDPTTIIKKIGYHADKAKQSGKEMRAYCPIHKETIKPHHHGDLSINLKEKVFCCHSANCGQRGDLVELYSKGLGLSKAEAIEELKKGFLSELSTVEKPVHGVISAKKEISFSEMTKAWENSIDCGSHRYLEEKKIGLCKGYKTVKNEFGQDMLLIPFFSLDGALKTIQRVFYVDDRPQKMFWKDQSVKDAYHFIGDIENAASAYITEGFATGATVYEALGGDGVCVVVAGSATTLHDCAKAIKEKYKNLDIVLALDVDQKGKFNDFDCVVPTFTDEETKIGCKDFNDILSKCGASLDEVSRQLKRKPPLALQSLFEKPIDYLETPPKPKPLLFFEPWSEAGEKGEEPFLHKGIVGMLVAEGGVGKTHLVAYMGLSIASGVPFLGSIQVKERGGVCLLFGEETDEDIHRLIYKTAKPIKSFYEKNLTEVTHKKVPFYGDGLDKAKSLFYTYSLQGMEASLIDENGALTSFFFELEKSLKVCEPKEGWSLIALDPLSRFAGSEAEKNNGIATAFISALEKLSKGLKGKPTVLVTHHKSKMGIREGIGQADARGSSAFTDGVRWQANINRNLILNSQDEKTQKPCVIEEIKLLITKTNYGNSKNSYDLARDGEGIFSIKNSN